MKEHILTNLYNKYNYKEAKFQIGEKVIVARISPATPPPECKICLKIIKTI